MTTNIFNSALALRPGTMGLWCTIAAMAIILTAIRFIL
jgi:hypothetical protein